MNNNRPDLFRNPVVKKSLLISGLASGLLLTSLAVVAEQAATPDDAGLAERLQACAACHGDEGRSQQEDYYPSIAGKPAGYLYRQLLNFRDGRRLHTTMRLMLAYLSDAYLYDIARYYARQSPGHHSLPETNLTEAQKALGKQLAQSGDPERDLPACTQCHGSRLQGRAPYIPGLTGLPSEYLAAQLGAWQAGTRQALTPDCMATIAQRLNGEDILAVSRWIAHQPTAADTPSTKGSYANLPMECGAVQ